MTKTLKILIIVTGGIAFILAGWNIVRYRWQSSLKDVYFVEYDGGTTIYRYDVKKGKTVVEAVLEGGYYSDPELFMAL